MNKMETGKYSELIRGDYLQQLDGVRGDRDRNQCIQEAIEHFLGLAPEKRRKEATAQRVRTLRPAGVKPEYYMWLEIVSISDDLAERLEETDGYVDSTKKLNAALRLWLETKEGVTGVKP